MSTETGVDPGVARIQRTVRRVGAVIVFAISTTSGGFDPMLPLGIASVLYLCVSFSIGFWEFLRSARDEPVEAVS